MNGIDWPATFTAAGTLVAAVGAVLAVVLGYVNRRAARVAADKASVAALKAKDAADAALAAKAAAEESKKDIIAATEDGLVVIGKQLDGRLTQLLQDATALARAEGVAQGEQAQRDRSSAAQG